MSLELSVNTKVVKNIPVIEIEGEIDVYTYPKLNDSLLALIEEGNNHIVVNLEKVTYIDSTGLGVLANSTNKLAESNGMLKVVCTKPQIIKIFSVSGLTNKNFRIYASESTALRNMGKPEVKTKIKKVT